MRKRIASSIAVIAILISSSVLTWSQQPSESINNSPADQTDSDVTIFEPFKDLSNGTGGTTNNSLPPNITIHSFSSGGAGPTVTGPDQAHLRKFVQLITELRATDNEAERSKLLGDIRDEVSQQFDRDLEQREKELVEIEARVARMRSQLETGRKNRVATLDSLMALVQNPKLGIGLRREWIDAIVGQRPFDIDPSTKHSPNSSHSGGIGTRIEPEKGPFTQTPRPNTDSQK